MTRRSADRSDELTSAVVICCFSEKRWALLQDAVASVRTQTVPPGRVVIAVDHNSPLHTKLRLTYPGLDVIASDQPPGLSGTRNAAMAHCREDVVAFLDDDAVADRRWLEHLLAEYVTPDVVAVGGLIEPDWLEEPPRWFPEEFGWVVGCSYRGQPNGRAVVRNVIGANMSVRRLTAVDAGGFGIGLGRVGDNAAGCEETELCVRMTQASGGVVVYQPLAWVRHRVPPERASSRYFRTRCLAEGRSKAMVARPRAADVRLATERRYVADTLVPAVGRAVIEAVRTGQTAPLLRATTIVCGLAYTGWAYVAGRARQFRSGPA